MRLALRLFRRDPMFTLIAVTTLALGIGGATTMFGVVRAALPFPAPEQLVMVYSTQPFVNPSPMSAPDFSDYKAQSTSFSW